MSKVVNISEAASLAIHSLAVVAFSETSLNAKTIASKLNVSLSHLSKMLQILAKNDFLESKRGPDGGFVLKKSADSITLLEVFEMAEGTIECRMCGIAAGLCPFAECVFGGIPEKVTQDLVAYMSSTKISDLKIK